MLKNVKCKKLPNSSRKAIKLFFEKDTFDIVKIKRDIANKHRIAISMIYEQTLKYFLLKQIFVWPDQFSIVLHLKDQLFPHIFGREMNKTILAVIHCPNQLNNNSHFKL